MNDLNLNNKAEIIPIKELLRIPDMRIPEYQRAYKWTDKNLIQLINDIVAHKNKSSYRLGTIVIHQNYMEKDHKLYNDIVDGQQRFTTLRIILYALCEIVNGKKNNYEEYIISRLNEIRRNVEQIKISYNNTESVRQIRKNYQIALRELSKYDTQTIRALLEKCEVVIFYITDITEAFQFFDSQNARGKDLYPHDLLKAFHLREFDKNEQDQQIEIVNKWEQYESKELAHVFSAYLYRIKGWADQNSSRQFSKKDIGMFKGINISNDKLYPYMYPAQIAHNFVENYNANYERNIDKKNLDYPFQLDGVIINGRRFFEYIAHYKNIIERFKSQYDPKKTNNGDTPSHIIFDLVYYNTKNHRDGEKYLLALFECLVIYYVDKFGDVEFDYFLEKVFIWVFSLRFRYQRLGFDSLDNYVVKDSINFFHVIRKSLHPAQILNSEISAVFPTKQQVEDYSKDGNNRMDPGIAKFFERKMYYAD